MIFLLVKRKKPAILKWTSPLRSAGLRNAISYNFYGIAGGFLELPRLSLGHSASSHTCSWWTNSKFNFVQNMFTPMIYLKLHVQRCRSQQILSFSTEPYHFYFAVKFYPPNPTALVEDITRYKCNFITKTKQLLN